MDTAAVSVDEPVPLKAVTNNSSELSHNDTTSACSNGAATGYDSSMHVLVNGHGSTTGSPSFVS